MKRAIQCALAAAAFAIAVSARADLLERIDKIPARIETVFQCGDWQQDHRQGFGRFILAYAEGQSEPYLQWVDIGKDYATATDAKVVRTIAIEEFQGEAAITITEPRCMSRKGKPDVIVFHARNANEDQDGNGNYLVKLTLGKIGHYTLEWQKMPEPRPIP